MKILLFFLLILIVEILLLLAWFVAFLEAKTVKLEHLRLRTPTSNGKVDEYANQLFGITFVDLSPNTFSLMSSEKEYDFSDG